MVKPNSQYTKYLVCYDIEDTKKRKKFSDFLSDIGLVRLQYSVFYGDLINAEIKALERESKKLLDEKTDKCIWFPCQISPNYLKKCIGYNSFEYIEPDGHAFI